MLDTRGYWMDKPVSIRTKGFVDRNTTMGPLTGTQVFPATNGYHYPAKRLTNLGVYYRRLQANRARSFPRIPRNPAPMTIELQGPRAKLTGSMDTFVPSPDFYNITSADDHALPGADVAAYAASPNSLYMYEQEKHDMLNTINGSICSPSISNFSHNKEDFDLKPQYELSSLNLTDLSGTPDNSCSQWIKAENIFDSDMSSDSLFPMDNSSNGPTLAELNMDESLIDEVVSLVNAHSAGFATSSSGVLCSKMDGNSVPTTSTLCSAQNNLPQTTDLKQILTKPTSSAVPRLLSSQNMSWMPQRKIAQVKPLTNVSSSITHPVQSPVVSTNFQNVPKPQMMGSFPREEKANLHQLLLRKSVPQAFHPQNQPITATPVIGTKRSATVAKMEDEDVEDKWNEIKKFIHEPAADDAKSSTSSQSKRSRHDSKSSTVTSNDDDDAADDDDLFSERDSDLDDDLSDEEGTLSQLSPLEESLSGAGGKKKDRQFFWQYNVQSKGPKGTRLKLELDSSNPHELKHFEDPVFDPMNTQVAGIRHGGKARKGDGNDVHPNPKRLVQIGMQIKRLNRKINEVTALGESTSSARNHSRKEKNKLASRACRLKKKAQHEANKVKLFGLESEHRQLMDVMVAIRAEMKKHVLEHAERTTHESLVDKLEELIKVHLKSMIAGNTPDYVNKVIANYEKGDPTGGLAIRRK